MSIRNHYLRESKPYTNSQPYGYTTRNNVRHFPALVSAQFEETETDEDQRFEPPLRQDNRRLFRDRSRSYELEETETDISVEELRLSPSHLLSPGEVETRQLRYTSLPDLQRSSGPSNKIPGGDRKQKYKSPFDSPSSYSIESVGMDLEETEDIFMSDDIPTEDVDDETESTMEGSEDFVNMRVKVERKPYPTKAVKVTVSVEPPSEVEENDEGMMDEMLLCRQYNEELLSVTSAEGDIVSSESEICSGSESQPSEGESEGEIVDEEIEEEESVCSSSQNDRGESSEEEEESNNSEDLESESGVESDSKEDEPRVETKGVMTKSLTPTLRTEEREKKTEETVEVEEEGPKDSTEVMMGLLDAAIHDSEEVKVKIEEKVVLAKIHEAEAIAIAEGERLAAKVMEGNGKVPSSPAVPVKGLSGSVVSGVQNAVSGVSSAVGSVKEKVTEAGEQGKNMTEKVKSDVANAKKELEESVAKVESNISSVGGKAAESIDKAKEQVKKIDKRIHHEASNIANGITKSGETALSEIKSLVPGTTTTTPAINKASSSGGNGTKGTGTSPPPPNSIVVANVIVHETPKSSQSPKLLQKPVVTLPSSTMTSSTIPTTTITTTPGAINVQPKPDKIIVRPLKPSTILATPSDSQPLASVQTSSALTSQISVPELSPKSTDSKFPEKEDYLSVCAADSMDSSEDDEDSILRKQKTKAETEEERRDVELAKDKLMEDWKSTRRASIDELDDKFQHILEDMVSEFSMEPVIPVLPKKLKEAVHVSDEESNKKSNSAKLSLDRSSEQTIEEESFDFEEPLPIMSPYGTYHQNRFTFTIPKKSSSYEISKQNPLESQRSRNISGSGRSNASRKSYIPLRSPNNGPVTPVKMGDRSSPKVSPLNGNPNCSPKTKLVHTPSKMTRTPSVKFLKVGDSTDLPITPVSESRKLLTPSKTLSRTASTKSLKTTQETSSSPKTPARNSSIYKSPAKRTSSNDKLVPGTSTPTKTNVKGEKLTSPTNSTKTVMTEGNAMAKNPANGNAPGENTSPKMLSPHSSPNMSLKESKNLSSPVNVSKSPSISRHSSLQTDQSMEETDWRLDNNDDLPNFNSNPEGNGEGGSDSERDEESPSQRRKWKNSTEIASTLSHYLHLIKTETVENSITEILPLITQLLVISRKSKTEHGLPTMIATLSAVRVLCERLIHVRLMSGEKALRNVDLSWLIRILCKLSADPASKLKPEASFTLAKLVKASGPDLITRPIYFLLVMESDGYGHKRGSQGSKTKAAALDTLTYALLTFPKEDFDDLEEIARWVCLVVMHPHRRVRQAALECIAVLGNRVGAPDSAVSRFRGYIMHESEQTYNREDSDGSNAGTKSAIKTFDAKGVFDVSAITAISCRIRKRILPLPSPYGLVEYGVKVPTGQELVLILTKMQEEEEEEYEGSTSEDSLHSSVGGDHHHSDGGSGSESIRMSDLEKNAKEDKVFGKKSKAHAKDEVEEDDDVDLITPDVAYILSGKGRVNKQELVNLNDENANNADNATQQDDKEKRRKALLRKKRHKKRHVERTYSEYEDDSPVED